MGNRSVTLPRAVQLVVDDVGWREGWDLSGTGGPYRAGVDRLLGPADYEAVADLGAMLGVRPQCAMVLCEWDRANVCARVPTSTQEGEGWDNRARAGEWSDAAAGVFTRRAAHIELALHGVGHEHWENGARTRAEWFGAGPEQRWAWEVLQGHLECFRQILAQHALDPDHGHSFPKSFVPCAFRYYWDAGDPQSTGALMRGAGVRICSTPFATCCFAGGPPAKPDGGFEHGVLVLDRGNSGVPWHVYDTVPAALPTTSICGIHWPNLLMPEPSRNAEALSRWAEYLRQVDRQEGWMLAGSMAQAASQWLHCHYTTLSEGEGVFHLDTTAVPETARENGLLLPPIVKLPLPTGRHVQAVIAAECHPVVCREEGGWAYLSLRLPDSGRASFRLVLGAEVLPQAVLRPGTCDVFDLDGTPDGARLALRVYGEQTVAVRLPFAPRGIACDNPRLAARSLGYDAVQRVATLRLAGRDIQGEEGSLLLQS